MLLDLPIAVQYTKRDPDFQAKLKFVGKPLAPGFYVIAFRKEDEQLARQFDAAIEKLLQQRHAEGDLRELGPVERRPGKRCATGERRATACGRPRCTGRSGSTFPCCWRGVDDGQTHAAGLPAGDLASGCRSPRPGSMGRAPLRWLATVYVEFFRGIPVLLLLFFLYYSLPEVGGMLGLPPNLLKLDAFLVGVIGFGLNYGGLRVGDLPGGHRLDPDRPMGGGGLAGHVAAADLLPHHPPASRSRSSCRR